MIIGIDTGGTFTDFVYKDKDRWGVYKRLSTPADPAAAIIEGLTHIAEKKRKRIVHGSTVATNAILERKGARTALVTNRGFEDIIAIGRQNRSRIYDLAYRKTPGIIPGNLRFGVAGRIRHTGEEHAALDAAEADGLLQQLKRAGVESVAVCLLFSFANPSHERRIKALIAPAGLPVSLSHEILAEFREYERTVTTVINAYVSPKMQGYIGTLMTHLDKGDALRIMQSNGGSITADTAQRESVRTILSGPAGGAVGAFEIGKMTGHTKIISFDMGGTSTDVSLMDGKLSLTTEAVISGHPIGVPMIDIHTVGAGGGSIAHMDAGGSLRVGPESAGADPGPICYGRGGRVTVTDANLYLGRILPEHFLGGNMRLRQERLESAFAPLVKEAGLSTLELAEGILSVANATMEKAIRVISVERGFDPGEFTLFSFGGAGGLHAAFLARLLNIPVVLVPPNPGILSALGMLLADVIKDYSLTVMKNQRNTTPDDLSTLFEDLEQRGRKDLFQEGFSESRLCLERYLDMRYEGQSFEIMVPFSDTYIDDFHRRHEKTYGYRNRDKIVEIVNIRLRARGTPQKPQFTAAGKRSARPDRAALIGTRDVVFDHRSMPTPIYDREKLACGNRIKGPAVVVEYSSTTIVPPFAAARVDEFSNLILEIMD